MRKIISLLFTLVLICTTAFPVFAETHPPRVVDNADLLSAYEETELIEQLDEISERQQFDIVVVTTNSLYGEGPMVFADDFYDYNGYGYGANADGVLLLVSMEQRDWWVTTTGYGITAITDAGLDYMSEKFVPKMSGGDYSEAFETFAELCDKFVTQAKEGEPYDIGNMPREPLSLLWIPGSMLIGAIISFIILAKFKSDLKTVRKQRAASDYSKPGSFVLTEQRDTFLYSKVDRRLKPKDTSSGGSSGGSSSHRSSSGRSHGGGGGKF